MVRPWWAAFNTNDAYLYAYYARIPGGGAEDAAWSSQESRFRCQPMTLPWPCLQATEKGDRPGLVAMLQKLLQLYAATRFGQRSFAVKGTVAFYRLQVSVLLSSCTLSSSALPQASDRGASL